MNTHGFFAHEQNTKNLIELQDLVMEFDGERILDGIHLNIKDKEFLTLLGPSGCGKTTTLRIIGGFLTATSGTVLFDGECINEVPPYKRQINTVFQRYALFPHLNVFDNIAFGLKMAGFHAEFARHLKRVEAGLESVRVGKISGAVGTYAFLSPELEQKALGRLGLKVDPHSTQIIQRDRYAHFFTSLAVMAGGVERLCVELRHLQRTEVLEVEEGFAKGQKGSSAMPHKKNPISAENMSGLSRLLRSNALAALEDQALWHERDISHSSVERVIMPDSTILADYVLTRLARLLEGLVVKPERMRENMERSFGLYFSQRVLTGLIAAGLPRQQAYEAVQRLAMQSWESRRPFPDLVREDADMRARLGEAALAELFDPAYYLQHEDAIFARVFSADAAEN